MSATTLIPVLFNVSASRISDGVACEPDQCPVALAMRERLGRDDVWVYPDRIYIGRRPYETPDVVRWFVIAFDDETPGLPPFDFALEIEAEAVPEPVE